MTLEEALARIEQLEAENTELKKAPNHRKDPYPDIDKYGISNPYDELAGVFKVFKRAAFGTVPVHRKASFGIMKTEAVKKTNELTDEEYAHYTEFAHDLFELICSSAKAWKEKEDI